MGLRRPAGIVVYICRPDRRKPLIGDAGGGVIEKFRIWWSSDESCSDWGHSNHGDRNNDE